MQIVSCTSGWTRNTAGELVLLWFNEKQFPDELMKPEKRRAPMTHNPVVNEETPPPPPQALCPQRFSALIAKCKLHDGKGSDDDCFAGNEGNESDSDTSDNDSDSGESDDEVYT